MLKLFVLGVRVEVSLPDEVLEEIILVVESSEEVGVEELLEFKLSDLGLRVDDVGPVLGELAAGEV